jgi:hypothetical protein
MSRKLRKFAVLFILGPILCAPALAADKIQQAIVTAKYVSVVVLKAGTPEKTTFPLPPRTSSTDIRVRSEVEEAFRKWGRYVVTIDPQAADLIVAVRAGRRAEVDVGGIGGIGTRGTTGGGVLGGEVGPSRDLMEVYLTDHLNGGEGTLLWQKAEEGGLDSPGFPLIQRFRKEVEAATKKKK